MPHDPRSSDQAVDALFGGNAAPKAKAKGSTKIRPEVEAPDDLKAAVDVMVAGRTFQKTIEKKIKTAEGRVKRFARETWAERFTSTGTKPSMFHITGNDGRFGYIQTKRIHLSAEKQEALSMLGVDIASFVETSGIKIDMSAIAALGYMEKLTGAIKGMVAGEKVCPKCNATQAASANFCADCGKKIEKVDVSSAHPEHVGQIFKPEVSVKDGILEALPNMVNDSLQDGEDLVAKLVTVIDTLGAVDQIKGPEIDKTSTECFELVMQAKLDAK